MATEKLYKISVTHTVETPTFSGEAVVIDNGGMSWVEMHQVDAVEVVHGEWKIIEDDYFDLVELECSVCGASYGFEDYEDDTPKNYHYCPNCGAKMDKNENP